MNIRTLLVATSNAHKTQEIQAMLGDGWRVEDLRAHPHLPAPEETGDTFDANARLKAAAASRELTDLLVLSDDSGLEVDALGRAPGVRSARYAGPEARDGDNREHLKSQLSGVPQDRDSGWAARFRCCMVLARAGETLASFEGAVEGKIIVSEQGTGGFGYDALFVPEGFVDSFGVLPAAVKNQLSHRARALEQVRAWLNRNSGLRIEA